MVPDLRFHSFHEDWILKKYGNTFAFKRTNSFSRDLLNYHEGSVKNIHYGDIHTKFQTTFNIHQEKVPFINKEVDTSNIRKEDYCRVGDIVIADASEDYNDVGKSIEIIKLDNQDLVSGLHTHLARPIDGIFALGFAGYLMQSWSIRLQVMMLAQGTKVHGITTGHLSEVLFKIPRLPEQQKIASFLTAVDYKIQQLTKKKELLEQYKNGVMQKIFKQEIRFKDEEGKEFPEWEDKKLSNFLTPMIRGTNKPSEKYLAIGIRSHGKGTFQKPDSDPEKISMEKLFLVKENDLIINITFAWEGAIAIAKEEDENGLVSHRFPTYILIEKS